MLLIPCPWCGERTESEFAYGGEARVRLPIEAELIDDGAWAQYLFVRENPAGVLHERWWHAEGCRCWFELARDTTTNRFVGTRPSAGPNAS
jgi:heterotetrameric sarcosine oxidase delta subunit